ncbi:DUF4062 domain-containing protein [Streptosporangium canum]|uniref:DUF4062 domain-containing protein n=1 Tax=Streptosporangium canum TaxID=324952 RepID=UPI00341D92FF
MAKVYVSSTFQDLVECRGRVRTTLRQMGHTDVAMEYYVAEDARPLERCLRDVADCDLYICVLALRYGHVPQGHDHSVTELEFRRARELGKPILAFVLKDGASWDTGQIEFAAHSRIQRFRGELTEGFLAGEFTDAGDLGAKVATAVHAWGREQDSTRPGHMVNWGSYRVSVTDRHRLVRLQVIMGARQDRPVEIPLAAVFVPQPCRSGRPDYDVPEENGVRADPVAEAVAGPLLAHRSDGPATGMIGREGRQVVLGGPGSGKSTLLLSTMLRLCEAPDSPVPIMVELRQYALDPSRSLLDYMVGSVNRDHLMDLDSAGLRDLLVNGASTVLFDGLDEVLGPNDRAKVTGELRAFAWAFPRASVVVTSRLAGYDAGELEQAGFSHYTLLDFGMPEIRSFIPKWYEFYTLQGDERDAHGLIRRIADNPRLRELAGNPLLLTMMAVIYKHSELPERRWQLYGKCTEVLLEDWDVKRKKIGREELLSFVMTAEQKAHLLQRVAIAMLNGARPGRELNAIARGPLLGIVSRYLQEAYRRSPGEARGIAAEILDHLRERTYVLAEIGENIFGFVHRTFMEFFAAGHVLAEFNSRESDFAWLTDEIFGPHWRSDDWREVLLLLAAMLRGQGSPARKVIEYVEHRSPRAEALAFAARLLGEAGAEPWAAGLVEKAVLSVVAISRQGRTANRDALVAEYLSALFLIGDAVPLSESAGEQAEALANASDIRTRLTAFQLGVALRGRADRLEFTLASLSGDEATSRGAATVLEREWPGNERAGYALLGVFDSERHARVRGEALRALTRGWTLDTELLDALSARVGRERRNVAEIAVPYLGERWAGDERALRLAIRFIALRAIGQDHSFDRPYFEKAHTLVAGSCRVSFLRDVAHTVSADHEDFRTRLIARLMLVRAQEGRWRLAMVTELFDEALTRLRPAVALALALSSMTEREQEYEWLSGTALRTSLREVHRACCAELGRFTDPEFDGRYAGDIRKRLLWQLRTHAHAPDLPSVIGLLLATGMSAEEMERELREGGRESRLAGLAFRAWEHVPAVLTGLIPELLDRVSQGHKAVDFFVEPVFPHAPPDDGAFQLMTSYARRDGSWEVRAFALSLLATRGAHPADLADDVASAVTLQGTRETPGWARRVLQTAWDLHRPED